MPDQYRVSWEMPPPQVTAYDYEDRYGPGIWPRLTQEQWDGLPWGPSENVTDDEVMAHDQYECLLKWEDRHEQPIRNVRLEVRPMSGWRPVAEMVLLRDWCCKTPIGSPHDPGCQFNPEVGLIDYDGPAIMQDSPARHPGRSGG